MLFAYTASAERQRFRLDPRTPGPNKTTVRDDPKYRSAIGKMNGCSVTVISPPESPVSVVLKAAHCGGGDSVQFPGEVVGGYSCIANRFYTQGREVNGRLVRRSSGDDLNICVSAQKPQTQSYGCVADAPPAPNTRLRFFGFGNPVFNRPQVGELLQGDTRLVRQDGSGALLAGGDAYVTPGDSGGPVIDRLEAGNTFNVVGVNSAIAVFNNNLQPFSYFAATGTPESQSFFRRALAAAGRLFGGGGATQEPLICGVNFQPADRNIAFNPDLGGGNFARRTPPAPVYNGATPTPIGEMIRLPTSVTH